MGRFLILAGFLIVVLGAVIRFKLDIPWLTGWIGKLPGDLIIKKGEVTIYLPIATSLFLSLVLSFLLSIFFENRK